MTERLACRGSTKQPFEAGDRPQELLSSSPVANKPRRRRRSSFFAKRKSRARERVLESARPIPWARSRNAPERVKGRRRSLIIRSSNSCCGEVLVQRVKTAFLRCLVVRRRPIGLDLLSWMEKEMTTSTPGPTRLSLMTMTTSLPSLTSIDRYLDVQARRPLHSRLLAEWQRRLTATHLEELFKDQSVGCFTLTCSFNIETQSACSSPTVWYHVQQASGSPASTRLH